METHYSSLLAAALSAFWLVGAPAVAVPKPGTAKITAAKPFAATTASEMQIKFEWTAASSGTLGAAPERGVEVLTLMAKEGQSAVLVSQHSKGGNGTKRTLWVIPTAQADGTIEMSITEQSEVTVSGETQSTSCTTTVRLKDGQTGLVHGSTGKEGTQGQENILFVTPSLLHSAS